MGSGQWAVGSGQKVVVPRLLPLLSAFCFLPSAFCFLPSAFLPSAFCFLPSAFCLHAYCLLFFRSGASNLRRPSSTVAIPGPSSSKRSTSLGDGPMRLIQRFTIVSVSATSYPHRRARASPLINQSGSASAWRASPAISAWPRCKISSAWAKVVIPPVATTGVLNPASCTARLIAATRARCDRMGRPHLKELSAYTHSRSARYKDRPRWPTFGCCASSNFPPFERDRKSKPARANSTPK